MRCICIINPDIETDTTIHRLYYDEAHHILGTKTQEIVFNNKAFTDKIEKTEFYTATPTNNNGIVMYDNSLNIHSLHTPFFFATLSPVNQ